MLTPEPGYEPRVGRIVAAAEDTRRRLMRDLDGITAEELDGTLPWQPNSVGTLLYHLAAIELDWLCEDLLEGEWPDGWEEWFPVDVREKDGRLSPVVEPFDRHLARLEWVRERYRSGLQSFTEDDLDRLFPVGEDQKSGEWILHHLMQHEGEHRGQIGEIRAALRAQ